MLEAKRILESHGFDGSMLEPAKAGLVNRVFLTPTVVLRVSETTNHECEARVALHALEVGVRTAKPLVWTDQYGLYERVQGESPSAEAESWIWLELLHDLKLLHAHPFEPRHRREPGSWRGDLKLLDTPFAAQLRPDDAQVIRAAFQPQRGSSFVFGHGDAFASNIIVNRGQYAALIDWGAARWCWLEQELAVLEDAAFELALQRFDVDLALVWAMRLELFLLVGSFGRVSIEAVRKVLEQVRLHRY
jgi:Phosphotransferase enzyme family